MHNDSSKFSIFTRDIILLPKSQDPWSLWAVLWKFRETTVVNGRGKYFIIEQPINQQNQPIRRTLPEFPRAQPANPFLPVNQGQKHIFNLLPSNKTPCFLRYWHFRREDESFFPVHHFFIGFWKGIFDLILALDKCEEVGRCTNPFFLVY